MVTTPMLLGSMYPHPYRAQKKLVKTSCKKGRYWRTSCPTGLYQPTPDQPSPTGLTSEIGKADISGRKLEQNIIGFTLPNIMV
jgi:hypothetical protein